MRKLVTTTALALCLGAATAHAEATARADMNVISRTGNWVTASGINDGGYSQCVTTMQGKLEGGHGASAAVMLKFDSHLPGGIGIQIIKETWNIPQNAQMKIALQIDNARALYFNAYQGNDQQQVEILLPFTETDSVTGENAVKELTDLLATGLKLKVWFPDGNERYWGVPLNGSAAEVQSFKTCISTILSRHQDTQPYSPKDQAQQTQPYSGSKRQEPPPPTTQPYRNL